MRGRNGLYTLLQVLPDADPAVIEAAYKALMKKYHPDRLGGDDAEHRAAAISHAFNVLRDPDRRAAYDAEEKAREDRYRVELARAFPEPPPGGEAPRRGTQLPVRAEPTPRAGQRVAGWVGVAGVIVLGATVVLLARGPQKAPAFGPAANVAAPDLQATAAEDDQGSVPFRDQPVNRGQVMKAIAEFKRITALSGLPGAADYSERCFETQAQSLDLNDFDYCVAFDHAAGRTDLLPEADLRSAAARRFQPQNQVSRHVRAADPMADTFSSIELRLFEIRRLADSVIAELSSRDTSELTAGAAAPQRTRSTRAPSPHDAARAHPPRASKQEQDFLERKGGIY